MFMKKSKADEIIKEYEKKINRLEWLNERLQQEKDNCFTYSDLELILSTRLDWYDSRIKRCKGLYTDAYIENLLVQRDELENVFEVIMNKYNEKVDGSNG